MAENDGNPGNAAGQVRDEDAFDVASVLGWLRDQTAAEIPHDLPEVTQFGGGASNLTYRLAWPDQPAAPKLILRRPPTGAKAKGAHDMGREFRIQAALKPVFDLVPTMVGHCTDEAVLGSEFYVMKEIVGVIPRRDFPIPISDVQAAGLCDSFLDTLVALHEVDTTAAGLNHLGKGQGYVARQVGGWVHRLAQAATDDLGDWSEITAWIEANQPADVDNCLIHNDYRLDNLVLDADDPTRIIGVLDWEMATLGDPLMDLGGALAYWVHDDDDAFLQSFRRQPSNVPGMLRREEIVQRYCERRGYPMTPEQWRFYDVFGQFRLAVIAQQIYYRYFHGQTTNPTYGAFGLAVVALEQRCRALLETA